MINTRQVNHIGHRQTLPSMTLMRSSVRSMNAQEAPRIKVQHPFTHDESFKTALQDSFNMDRLTEAIQVEKSEFISHFTRPLGSTFTPTHNAPIKAVVHKPKVELDLSIDEILLKAVDNIEAQLLNLEQQPVRRLNRFTRALVANRFNGVALD